MRMRGIFPVQDIVGRTPDRWLDRRIQQLYVGGNTQGFLGENKDLGLIVLSLVCWEERFQEGGPGIRRRPGPFLKPLVTLNINKVRKGTLFAEERLNHRQQFWRLHNQAHMCGTREDGQLRLR